MGHYYSEMCCEKCGSIRCTCPPPPKPVYNDGHFVIVGLEIQTIKKFKETWGVREMFGTKIRTMNWEIGMHNRAIYTTLPAAEKALLKVVRKEIQETQKRLKSLQKLEGRLQ